MVNLSNLPYDLLAEIAIRLKKLEDFTSFRSVSKSVRAAAREEYFLGLRLRQRTPYLMLPVTDDEDDIREFYSLIEGESIVASVKVPNFKSKKCLESLGWLVASRVDGSMSLLDPFAGTEIPLPHQHTFLEYEWVQMDEHVFVEKVVLSSRPSETCDFILMIIAGGYGHLAFWRLGDKEWNRIEIREGRYRDVVYHGGQFYAYCNPGVVWVFNLAGKDNQIEARIVTYFIPKNVTNYKQDFYNELADYKRIYIFKAVDNSLLIISRTSGDLSTDGLSYMTTKFQVYEVDIQTGTWEEIYSLGSMAVFLGHNSTTAVDTSRFSRGIIKANHIYFTDDDVEFYYYDGPKGGGMDTGIYNFETGFIEPVYPGDRGVVQQSFSIHLDYSMFLVQAFKFLHPPVVMLVMEPIVRIHHHKVHNSEFGWRISTVIKAKN